MYAYSATHRSARRYKGTDISWITEFLLTRYSHKHVFLPRRLPNIMDVGTALSAWAHRLQWVAALENVPEDPFWRLKSKRQPTPFRGELCHLCELSLLWHLCQLCFF